MKRYQKLTDLFTVTCKKCGSTDVDLFGDNCEQCGLSVIAECNKCKSRFDGHDFVFGEYEKD